MKLQYYIMENVAIHGMGGNYVYKLVPKYKKISKINEITIHHVKPWGSKVPAKSMRKDSLAFLIESREEWISSSGISCMSVWQWLG